MKTENIVHAWDNNLKYFTEATVVPEYGLTRTYRAYSSLSGEEYFLGTVLDFENCFGGVGGQEGGVIRGLRDTLSNCELSIIDQ